MSRIVCQFSCGAASAVATKLTLVSHPEDDVLIVNAVIREEHPDNRRFLADCEHWFLRKALVLQDEKYGASTHEVWRRERYIKGLRGAPCSRALKRELLSTVALPDDVNVIGFTVEEEDRFCDLQERFSAETFVAPLIEKGLDKGDCLAIVERAGIELPYMYRLGYPNANCIGCPKGGQNYWQAIRHDFPEQFAQIKAIQEDIGPGANFLRFRSGSRAGERMSLADLPPGRGNLASELSFSCSFACDITVQEIAENCM